MQTVQLKEHQKTEVSCCGLVGLEKYLERNKLSAALKVTANAVKAKNYVGVIKYKNTQFEILPKLISEYEEEDKLSQEERVEQNQTILKNLVFMLSYTKNLDIKSTSSAKLAKTQNPFLEVLIREYAESLFDCLKRLTPKNYIREEDNLNYLKGKLKFTENIRYNCANQAKFYCEYDEFSEDCVLNQLFNFVSICLHSISKDSNNKKLLKFIMNYYQDIKLVRFDKFKCKKIRLNRNQQLFKKPFELAKMFIEQSSVDLSKNKFENIALLWDMNKLFEEFLYQIIKKHISVDSVDAKVKKFLLKTPSCSHKRHTEIDILVDKKLIIDAKYKKIETFDNVANADMFQVSTYCLLNGLNEAILLYPLFGTERPKDIENEYRLNTLDKYDDCNYKLRIEFIDLKYNDLKKDLDSRDNSKIIARLEEILKVTKKEEN